MKDWPETDYAWNGNVALAYQVFGEGPEDAGEHELKGVPDRWHLYRVVT